MSPDAADDLIALPMHGEVKLRMEGYRTRDGHVLEWLERLRPDLKVTVRSRPEPFPRVTLARRRGYANPAWAWQSPEPKIVPPLRHRRRWWVDSLAYESSETLSPKALLAWNPIAAAHLINHTIKPGTFVMDLLDDWSVHVLFQPIKDEVEAAYSRVFERADHVTANSEGTVELAARFGREAHLIPNGCDPEYFSAAGDRRLPDAPVTIGYVGKLSERLDVKLVEQVASRLPEVKFEISGPYVAASRLTVRQIKALSKFPNIRLGGNVQYERLPETIAGWDIGWVPHRLGKYEVGGDVIKTYEYRAAGLPVITTRIIGSDRLETLDGITVIDSADQAVAAIRRLIDQSSTRPERVPSDLDPNISWRAKTNRILALLDL